MNIQLTEDVINDVFIDNPTKIFRDIEKAHRISKLRLLGYTYKEIGKECDVSPSRARGYVVRTLAIYRQRKRKEQAKMKMKMTNYEKIKNMSIEEMAEKLAEETKFCVFVDCPEADSKITTEDCRKCIAKWLESEVEE